MMVSRMTAVLPVWRSPMISSRCPRPIGIMLSIALMPVWRGSRTGWRSSTPGAMRSSGLRCFVKMGPLPSTGWPSGFTTRPTSASPTGTDIIVFVRLTTSPSFNSVDLVRKGQHLAGHDLFQAMNARNAVADADNRANFVHRNGLLVVLNLLAQNLADFVCLDVGHACSVAPAQDRCGRPEPFGAENPRLFRCELCAHLVQAAPQRAIINRVPDPHARAAQQRRIERILCFDFLARQASQGCRQLFFLCRAQFHSGRNLRFRHALPLPNHLLERGDNLRN